MNRTKRIGPPRWLLQRTGRGGAAFLARAVR